MHQFRTRFLVTPHAWGPARMDAIGMIVNRLTAGSNPTFPRTGPPPLAPTKPPFLWNAPQGLWTQWRGVQQDPIDRNLTETMGVFMSDGSDLQNARGRTVRLDGAMLVNLQKVEELLQRLAPPKWPEDVFGKIDREKARRARRCSPSTAQAATTPGPIRGPKPNKYGKRFVLVGLVPQTYVGTDPGQFDDLRPYAITGQFERLSAADRCKDKRIMPTGDLYGILRTDGPATRHWRNSS